ncbi:hypothetical protein C8Q80DRAFT_14747 [Daedaleopsis nitida]|nr:hypothetical protein C8Q80DRAFT_14747 [Daedaleopsis nitida]
MLLRRTGAPSPFRARACSSRSAGGCFPNPRAWLARSIAYPRLNEARRFPSSGRRHIYGPWLPPAAHGMMAACPGPTPQLRMESLSPQAAEWYMSESSSSVTLA